MRGRARVGRWPAVLLWGLVVMGCPPMPPGLGDAHEIIADTKEPDLDVAEPEDAGPPTWFGTDVPIFPGEAGSTQTFCSAGGRVEGDGVSGTICLGPQAIPAAPATGDGVLWLPGPVYQLVP